MNKFFALILLVVFVFSSCVVTPAKRDFTYPSVGSSSSAGIVAVKDYTTVGIIFVNSTEVIDTIGNHTGSKITYEMLMREAARLNADDIINIKMDVNQVDERMRTPTGSEVVRTTFNYSATAIAIRYTNAVAGGGIGFSETLDSSSTVAVGNADSQGGKSGIGRIIGIAAGVIGALVLGGVVLSNL